MAKITLIWLICFIALVRAEEKPVEYNGFCFNMFLHRVELIPKLENCSVVVGNLKIVALERTTPEDFVNVTFPKLREVTGFMVVYRVFGIESLGKLFPNLSRIRGNTLLYNYALIVYDMVGLIEVGLYNLLKIDRGGVIIWGNPLTCFVDTIDWDVIAPNSRHVLRTPDWEFSCNFPCTCSEIKERNRCWNNIKCQRFLSGPTAENCSSECLGCLKTRNSSCTLCRNYTYEGKCVPRCPDRTYVLSGSNHCITADDCFKMPKHWPWNNKCISDCPTNFIARNDNGNMTCTPSKNHYKRCGDLVIQALSEIQSAEKCVHVDGFLKIHIWSIPQVVEELNYYLKNIEEVSDYIVIYGSIQFTSLNFLSSLKRIRGQTLYNGNYSLVIHDMYNLQTLFPPSVTQNLKVDRGSLSLYRNRMLCPSEIDKLITAFPIPPGEIDIPLGLNGYSAGCKEVYLNLNISVKNETYAVATFVPLPKNDVHYALLYVKIPHDSNLTIVPESCSDSEWNAINIHNTSEKAISVILSSLSPATMYAACIEKYDPSSRQLSRSNITTFMTAIGKPEPPFILELVASSYNVIVIRWVNHLDYRSFITKYELDITLVEIHDKDITIRDHCIRSDDDFYEIDYSRHAKVMRPPKNYEKGCESMCGVLSSATKGAMVEDFFNVCNAINGCDQEFDRPKNISDTGHVQSLALDLKRGQKTYQIGDLLPYRDYKVNLRACINDLCSVSTRGVVRTLRLLTADIVSIKSATANRYGFIDVKWEPPEKTNGPLLSYTVEVYAAVQKYDINHILPQTWCVPGNTTSLKEKSHVAEKYLVRICSTTLGNVYICNDWTKVVALSEYELSWWWSGIIFGVCLNICSCILGWRLRVRSRNIDNIPLVDASSTRTEGTEPPAAMFSDFMPMHGILLRDLHLE